MFHKPFEKLVVALIAVFLATSCAIFPENGTYYGFLTQGLDTLAGAGIKHVGIVERGLSALIAWLWQIGGTLCVRISVFILIFVFAYFAMALILVIARFTATRFSLPRLAPITGWLIILLLALLAVKSVIGGWEMLSTDSRLLAPLDLLKFATKQKADNIYFNPYAWRFVRPLHTEWMPKESAALWKEAAENPSIWRKMDRAHRFDLVLLSGPTVEFKPLLDHLMSSPDWILVYFDNGGFAFARQSGQKPIPPTSADLSARFTSPSNKAKALAQAAMQCAVLQNYEKANALLRDGEVINSNCPEIFTTQAYIHLERQNWSAAINNANKALAQNPTSLTALQIKAQALLKNKDPDQAFLVSREIITLYPDDFYSLLLHAQIANTAHAYQSETRSLERVIEIAEKNEFPTAVYRVFLGQSYAKQGMGRPAIEQLDIALKDPSLSEEQRKQVRESLATVRQ
ncbi:MAG: hypothetical protein ABIP97_05005, partial [Chthoniobacterales bacterium]